jgi:hypothetical protein
MMILPAAIIIMTVMPRIKISLKDYIIIKIRPFTIIIITTVTI